MRKVTIEFASTDFDAVEIIRRLGDDISEHVGDVDVYLVLDNEVRLGISEVIVPDASDSQTSFRIVFDVDC